MRALRDSTNARAATGIVLLAYGLAFGQRPGRTFTDTRIELTADPARFLHAAASMWSSTGDLGHVQSGQFIGYLVPMAPWYAIAHALAIPTWIAQRIWLGTLLALAGLGVMRLLTALLLPRRAPVAAIVGALLFVANPYVAIVAGRTSAWLVSYAALPWLLLAVHRGLRSPRRWGWAAVIALLMLLANGGVNAALPFWLGIAALTLLVYEVTVLRSATWRSAGGFACRSILCSLVVSLWWVVPALLTTRYAPNFLSFTEQPLTILATPSASESLRLLGYWVVYYGLGSGPATPSADAGAYLFEPLVILATFAVPMVAFAGFAWTRRWAYAPFFVLLGAGTLLVMSLGFPPGSLMNRLLVPAYYNFGPLEVLRTTWKAAPLLALSLACLAGVSMQAAADWLQTGRRLRPLNMRIPAWGLLVLAPVPVLWGWPLFNGTAINPSQAYGSVPRYWHAALSDATRATTANQRIMVLPGELFGWYRWGETVDSAFPFMTPRRLAIREIERHSDLRASQLQIAVDDLVQQDRLLPGQFEPLLRLLGVGSVLVGTDGDLARDGALDPAGVAHSLRGQTGFDRPAKSYGTARTYLPAPGHDGPALKLPDARRYAVPSAQTGVVRVHPFGDTTVLDGDGYGITELAAQGMLDPRRALIYAGDLRPGQLTSLVHAGARLAFSDSNRLRVVEPSTTAQDLGPTLEPGDPIAADTPYYSLFPGLGAAGETVAQYSGLLYLRSPGIHRGSAIFPEDRPYAALDGRLDTAWVSDPQASPSQRYLELALRRPRMIPSINLYPLSESLGATTWVSVSVNGGPAERLPVKPGWNRIPISTGPVRRLRIAIAGVSAPGVAGGLTELQIPGLQVREAMRLPTHLASAARSMNLNHNDLSILLSRTSADLPYREHPYAGDLQGFSSQYARDPEPGISRVVTLPAVRTFALSGWASVRYAAPDPLLDRLAGVRAGWSFSSSDRYQGLPINRASSALDGDRSTAWVAHFVAAQGIHPWLKWSWPRPLTVQRLRLIRGAAQYEFPSRVAIGAPGGTVQDVPVASDGDILLPQAVHARTLILQVLAVAAPIGKANFERLLDAVAIAELRMPGLRTPAVPRRGRFTTRCGELSAVADAQRVPVSVYGTLSALDHGEPLRLRGCGRRVTLRLSAGANALYAPPGLVMQPDHLALISPAPDPLPAPGPQTLASPGTARPGSQQNVHPGATGRSWLVLGEGYSRGWQAWCRDRAGHERGLGAAQPVDGYANGWQIGPGCRSARMAFVPQSEANLTLILSGVAGVLMALFLLGARLSVRARSRRAGATPPPPAGQAGHDVAGQAFRYGLLPAAGWGFGMELLGALLFAPRFGVIVGLLTFLLVLVGIGVRRLVLLAALAIAAVPWLYLVNPANPRGGAAFYFPQDHLTAHWLASGATLALAVAALLQARGMRSARGGSDPSAASAERPATAKSEGPRRRTEPAVRS